MFPPPSFPSSKHHMISCFSSAWVLSSSKHFPLFCTYLSPTYFLRLPSNTSPPGTLVWTSLLSPHFPSCPPMEPSSYLSCSICHELCNCNYGSIWLLLLTEISSSTRAIPISSVYPVLSTIPDTCGCPISKYIKWMNEWRIYKITYLSHSSGNLMDPHGLECWKTAITDTAQWVKSVLKPGPWLKQGRLICFRYKMKWVLYSIFNLDANGILKW